MVLCKQTAMYYCTDWGVKMGCIILYCRIPHPHGWCVVLFPDPQYGSGHETRLVC